MMARLAFWGYFDEFPNLKIITHHMGGMVHYFGDWVGPDYIQETICVINELSISPEDR